jgi:LSD1 subclass zinc finger protein
MQRHPANTNAKVRAALAAVFLFVASATVFYSDDLTSTVSSQARRATPRATRATANRYAAFPHDTKAHQMDCGKCHTFPSSNWKTVRTGDAAFPDITDYPKHDSCISCHRQQFFRGARPVICSICHTVPGPRGSARHPFPNPREIFDASAKGKQAQTDFQISFSHEKHIGLVGQVPSGSPFRTVGFTRPRAADENCAVCHTTIEPQGTSDDEFFSKPPATIGDAFWLKKGTFKSVPTGHTTCFTCHSQDAGIAPAPTDCATCHKLKQNSPAADFDPKLATQVGVTARVMLDAWRRRDSTGTFRHEFASHAELSCDTCHNVQSMDTLNTKSKRVGIASCAACHVTATVDDGGALNFEMQSRKSNAAFQCTKCHITFGKLPIPQSHTQAVIDAGGKP